MTPALMKPLCITKKQMVNMQKILDFVQKIIRKHPELCQPICENSIDEMYTQAFYLYQNGQWEKAINQFQCLVFHRPLEPIYWEGLASSYFRRKDYALAIKTFAMVSILAPKNGQAHLFAAESYFSLGKAQEGLKALQQAKKLCKEKNILFRIDILEKNWEERHARSC
jgi:tetratricopeptide (TPR) repeat protein